MENRFSGIQAVGQIVADFPQAADIFQHIHLENNILHPRLLSGN